MAAWQQGRAWWCRGLGSGGWLLLFSRPCSASGVNPTSSPLPIPFRPPQTSTTLCACHLSRSPRPRLARQARSYSLLRAPPTCRPRQLCHVCPRVPPNSIETTPQQALENQPIATVAGCQAASLGPRPLPRKPRVHVTTSSEVGWMNYDMQTAPLRGPLPLAASQDGVERSAPRRLG
jgi:hypothetical protein